MSLFILSLLKEGQEILNRTSLHILFPVPAMVLSHPSLPPCHHHLFLGTVGSFSYLASVFTSSEDPTYVIHSPLTFYHSIGDSFAYN